MTRRRRILCLLLTVFAIVGAVTGQTPQPTPKPTADLVIRAGAIHTMAQGRPTMRSIAIGDGKVLRVGEATHDLDGLIGPSTQLEGNTTVRTGARIGPGCLLRDTAVGDGATVVNSVCESAVVDAGFTVGPFAHLSGGRDQ